MLVIEAYIRFDKKSENEDALNNDLSTEHRIVPAINFGNGFLYSAFTTFDKDIDIVERGYEYKVLIEVLVFDVNEPYGYQELKPYLKYESRFLLQLASRVIGYGTLVDYFFLHDDRTDRNSRC